MPDAVQRVCLMTGASGGLGSTALPMFVDAGFRVAAVALDWPVPLTASASLLPLTADLTSAKQAEGVVRQTMETFERVDCLVHMAGYFPPSETIENTPSDVWDRTLAVNLSSAFHIMRAAIGPMKKAGGGRIVVVGSTVAIQPVATWGAFSAAMGGLEALVKAASAELREHQITVNLVNPSTIATPAVCESRSEAEIAKWVDPKRMTSLILWLCSDAGEDVSGASIALPARQEHPSYQWPGITFTPGS